VDADGFADAKGLAVLRAYDSLGNMVKDPPRFFLAAPIQDGSARFRLGDFPSGVWAFVVFQDRNGNNEIDHGWNRFPSEPLGYSRGFVPGISAGMPTYGKAGVPVKSPADTIRVTVAAVDFKSFFRGKSQ
jgi:uncharacterized protein (DUF2141 family)